MGKSKVAAAALDGWGFSGIARLVCGAPFTVTMGTDDSLTGVNLDRPNLVGDTRFSVDRSRNDQVARWFNTAAFQARR